MALKLINPVVSTTTAVESTAGAVSVTFGSSPARIISKFESGSDYRARY